MRNTMLVLAVAALAGCGQTADQKATGEPAAATASSSAMPSGSATLSACADQSDRLPLTGLCRSGSGNYLLADASAKPSAPEGCEWQVGETELAGGDVLLYRALKCGDKAAKVEFSGGAERAELQLTSSALQGDLPEPLTLGYFYVVEGDPAKAVTDRARSAIADSAEAAGCAARPAKVDTWPSDAMVVDTTPPASTPDGSPVAVCGDLGYFDEGNRFWRVSQGYAWFFDFGQDLIEIDPGTITLVVQEGGQWRVG